MPLAQEQDTGLRPRGTCSSFLSRPGNPWAWRAPTSLAQASPGAKPLLRGARAHHTLEHPRLPPGCFQNQPCPGRGPDSSLWTVASREEWLPGKLKRDGRRPWISGAPLSPGSAVSLGEKISLLLPGPWRLCPARLSSGTQAQVPAHRAQGLGRAERT